jgi:hypothetical protein
MDDVLAKAAEIDAQDLAEAEYFRDLHKRRAPRKEQ